MSITTNVLRSNPTQARCTRYNIMWYATGRWFSSGTAVSSTNKTDNHDITDITELLLNVTLSTIKPNQTMTWLCLTVTEYTCHKCPRTCSTCRKHYPVLYLFMISLSWLVFVTRVTRCVSPVEQELLTPPEYLTLSPVCSGVRVARFLVFYVVFFYRCLSFYPFVLFLLSIVLSFLLRFTGSDYPSGIFKIFLMSALYKTNTLSWMLIELVHWKNSPKVDLSLHTDTLLWF